MSRKTSLTLAFALLLALSTTACGSRMYAYAPVTTTSAEIVGHPAAELPFPPDSPQGHVRLATLGLSQPTPGSPRSIHVRMVATNRGSEPWLIEKSEQQLAVALGDGERTSMVRASTEPPSTPTRIEVGPGQTVTVDLYFPLPSGALDASDVPAFDALWAVHSGSRVITTRTPFERFLTSSPAQKVPTAGYPYTPRTTRDRMPGTPDSRWPAEDPVFVPDATPRPPVP